MPAMELKSRVMTEAEIITIEEKRRELIREIALRQRVYGRTMQEAPHRTRELERRIAVMRAILRDYEQAQNESQRGNQDQGGGGLFER